LQNLQERESRTFVGERYTLKDRERVQPSGWVIVLHSSMVQYNLRYARVQPSVMESATFSYGECNLQLKRVQPSVL
jgi:hypothetical protein